MFRFWKRKPAPTLCPSNPGIGTTFRVAFQDGEQGWTEEADLVALVAEAMARHGHRVARRKGCVEHRATGMAFSPQFVELQPLAEGGVHTVTTIQADHPSLPAAGVFEYQHSAGDSAAAAVGEGFHAWAQTDLVVLLDCLREQPETCMTMEVVFPASGGQPSLRRRAVFSPVTHHVSEPEGEAASEEEGEHPFCPCCLFTHSAEAFKELFEADAFYGLRLFVARHLDGTVEADCRVNGVDWEAGVPALQDYARTWAPASYEFRKQYVILQTLPSGT